MPWSGQGHGACRGQGDGAYSGQGGGSWREPGDDAASDPYLPTVDYWAQLRAVADVKIYMNVALPGAVHQNPHWDTPNWKGMSDGALVIDVPLDHVGADCAPFEIWPGTHNRTWHTVLSKLAYTQMVSGSSDDRQYKRCYPELNVLAKAWTSVAVLSTSGDAIIRSSATLHRGTSNLSPKIRDMLTFFIRKLPKHRKRPAATVCRKPRV